MHPGETTFDTLECCQPPSLLEVRHLAGSPRKGLCIERCSSCGANRPHAWEEISMGGLDDDEVDFDTYARLTPEEAASIPQSPSAADLAFLADRTVFYTGVGGLKKRRGWTP